jgi:mxaJ protein
VREGLNGGQCDVLPGVAANLETVLTTRPYYRSTYAFLWRAHRDLQLSSLNDPRLADLTIAVQMVGDDLDLLGTKRSDMSS